MLAQEPHHPTADRAEAGDSNPQRLNDELSAGTSWGRASINGAKPAGSVIAVWASQ